MAEHATIVEVGPRDGLQNEARTIPAADKIRLVDMLSAAGFTRIEVTSFVSPRWVPQMADAAEVMAGISRVPGVSYAVLTPNLRGLEAALAAGANEAAVFLSASEGFSKANINATIAESFDRIAPIMERAARENLPVRGYVSAVIDCPYDGPTPPEDVARVAARLAEMGCFEISLGDTLGRGTPERVAGMLRAVTAEVPADRLAGHFHDTFGHAPENIEASLDLGLRVFDASVAGLGGCPYAPGAAGNVASETVRELLESRGLATGIDPDRLSEAAEFARSLRSA